MLSIMSSSNPLFIQRLDEFKAACTLAGVSCSAEYPIRGVTPWLGIPRPAGPSLVGVSGPISILVVLMALARRSRLFGVGWLASTERLLFLIAVQCK